MEQLYECHITMVPPVNNRPAIKDFAKKHKFKTSEIVGDPVLGDDKTFFYLTGHDSSFSRMKDRMELLAGQVAGIFSVKVLRMKIEQILYDERTPLGDLE